MALKTKIASVAAILGAGLLCAAAPRPVSPPSTWRLSPDGMGPLRIGMTYQQTMRVLGVRLGTWSTDNSGNQSFACDTPELHGYPGMWLLFENGRLNSISLDHAPTAGRGSRSLDDPSRLDVPTLDVTGVPTAEGLKLGSLESEIRGVYGKRIQVSARPYFDEPSHQLSIWDQGRRRGVAFDTNEKGVVEKIAVGGRSIFSMEGCL